MGCDIHAHLEVKMEGKWEHYSDVHIRRNYALFEKMAGVRGNGLVTPICEAKGLPNNLSKVTALDYDKWEGDAHTISWFNPDEIQEAVNFHIKTRCDVPSHIPDRQYSKYIKEKIEKSEDKEAISSRWMDIVSQWGYVFGNSVGDFNKYREDFPLELEDIRLVFWFDN